VVIPGVEVLVVGITELDVLAAVVVLAVKVDDDGVKLSVEDVPLVTVTVLTDSLYAARTVAMDVERVESV